MVEASQNVERAAGPRRPPLRLRDQLLVLSLAFAVVPLLLASVWGHVQSRKLLGDAALLNLENVAALAGDQARDEARDQLNALQRLVAGNGTLAAHMRGAASPDAALCADAADALRTHLRAKRAGSFAELFALGVQGRLLAASDSPTPAAQRRCYLSSTPLQARLLGIVRSGGQPTLLLAAPVRDDGGALVGYLCARATLPLEQVLQDAGGARAMQAHLALVDPWGAILAGGSAPELEAATRKLDPRQRWSGALELGDGARAFAAIAPVPELGVAVVAELPVDQALEGIARVQVLSAAFTAAVLLVLLGSVVLAVRRLSRPLAGLASAAQRAAGGTLGEPVPVEGPAELAELAAAFNTMTLALKASQASLEQRVQARTRDLQASQDLSELLINAIDQRVVVIDRDHRVVKANQAARRRYPTELLGASCHALFEARDTPCEDCPAARAFATGKPQLDERTEGGGSLTEIVEVRAVPLFGRDGQVRAVVRLTRVVTAEKQLQAQMMYREKMSAFGLLAAGVAHEIGNPLASIESQLRLAREAPEPGRVERTLEVVGREVARIGGLLRDLVNFARRPRSEQTLVSLNQVVEDVARLLSHDPRARSVTLERRLAPEIPGVRAKEDHLVQVLLNLGINALDAMPEGGTLEFSTGAEDEHAVVRVRDTGHGVPEAAQDHIFEPFFTTKDVGRGTGLGLFVSKSIVRDLKGQLSLERTGRSGTTFSVRLPAARAGGRP